MIASYISSGILIVVAISGCLSLSYSDLEALGNNCPSRDRCQGYSNHLTYMDRSCECDFNCTAYGDCCIDAVPTQETSTSRPAARTEVKCLHYGKEEEHTGVYVISKCSDSWTGSRKVSKIFFFLTSEHAEQVVKKVDSCTPWNFMILNYL